MACLGGGLALAKGFETSGLSTWMGEEFQTIFSGSNPVFMVMGVSVFVAAVSEMTSNTATAAMTLPVLGPLAVAIKANPLLLMVPATVAASCGFMLPVSTPPNAIVYGSGRLTINDMMKAGIVLDILAVFIITLATFTLGAAIFGLTGEMPDWATAGK
ncbi:MAG: SLC13 family permease [Candidatus Hydrogenedentota bacterium]